MKNSQAEKHITVKASGEYQVIIGKNLIGRAGEKISQVIKPCKIALVTDDVVDALYSKTVIESLVNFGFEVVKYVFLHGEESKNLNTYGKIVNFLAENRLTRTDALVALGGGVVGDMAGFAAATYLRGIKYVQIPTTLLAQIDSSVGGKTAIDLAEGKNLVGAFCQPSLVICDVDTLKSLDEETFTDGMGETAKYLILDEKIFNLVESGNYSIQDLVYACVDYKRKVVEADEFEGGMRKLLNLGHTPAHGIERLSGYTITHGKAVAMGLKIILANSKRYGFMSQIDYERAMSVISKCVKDTESPYSIEDITESAMSDKKRSGNTITLMMVHGIGDVRESKITIEEFRGYLK